MRAAMYTRRNGAPYSVNDSMNYNAEAITITRCGKEKKKEKAKRKKWLAPDTSRLHHRDFVLDTRADCLTLHRRHPERTALSTYIGDPACPNSTNE